jgi:predicted GIY-YIG superfamily endonuclease
MTIGIYCIHNTVNGKRYVGQSVNIHRRKSSHLWELKNGRHGNEHLQRAFTKHGEEDSLGRVQAEVGRIQPHQGHHPRDEG